MRQRAAKSSNSSRKSTRTTTCSTSTSASKLDPAASRSSSPRALGYRNLQRARGARCPSNVLRRGVFAGFAAVLVLVLVWCALLRRPVHHRRRAVPLQGGAFFCGGTPARDAVLEKFL